MEDNNSDGSSESVDDLVDDVDGAEKTVERQVVRFVSYDRRALVGESTRVHTQSHTQIVAYIHTHTHGLAKLSTTARQRELLSALQDTTRLGREAARALATAFKWNCGRRF